MFHLYLLFYTYKILRCDRFEILNFASAWPNCDEAMSLLRKRDSSHWHADPGAVWLTRQWEWVLNESLSVRASHGTREIQEQLHWSRNFQIFRGNFEFSVLVRILKRFSLSFFNSNYIRKLLIRNRFQLDIHDFEIKNRKKNYGHS